MSAVLHSPPPRSVPNSQLRRFSSSRLGGRGYSLVPECTGRFPLTNVCSLATRLLVAIINLGWLLSWVFYSCVVLLHAV